MSSNFVVLFVDQNRRNRKVRVNPIYYLRDAVFDKQMPLSMNAFVSGHVINGGWKLKGDNGKLYVERVANDSLIKGDNSTLVVAEVTNNEGNHYDQVMFEQGIRVNAIINELGLREDFDDIARVVEKVQGCINSIRSIPSPDSYLDDTVANIAKEQLGIKTLDQQHQDSQDFHEVAVWTLKAALTEAFKAGQAFEIQRTGSQQDRPITAMPEDQDESEPDRHDGPSQD